MWPFEGGASAETPRNLMRERAEQSIEEDSMPLKSDLPPLQLYSFIHEASQHERGLIKIEVTNTQLKVSVTRGGVILKKYLDQR